ncbi:hypothetical protein [Frankia sp. Cas3]|uniref:hypothetical protein n=1 Tax=Frankia sp. Cas3 TaxID=3073926 RepID=UPI002AD3FE09|nr:hypothetical protein [Frankia sp. Cas3]
MKGGRIVTMVVAYGDGLVRSAVDPPLGTTPRPEPTPGPDVPKPGPWPDTPIPGPDIPDPDPAPDIPGREPGPDIPGPLP